MLAVRWLHFHVQLRRASGLRGDAVAALLASVAAKLKISDLAIQPRKTYWNFDFRCRSLDLCERASRLALRDKRLGAKLRRSSIVACEGSRGWDNYLLLHHFDPAVVLDRVRRRRLAQATRS
jgi:hypothetical protein